MQLRTNEGVIVVCDSCRRHIADSLELLQALPSGSPLREACYDHLVLSYSCRSEPEREAEFDLCLSCSADFQRDVEEDDIAGESLSVERVVERIRGDIPNIERIYEDGYTVR